MSGEWFFTKHHMQFPENEKGSFAQGMCQWENTVWSDIYMDTSSEHTGDAAAWRTFWNT